MRKILSVVGILFLVSLMFVPLVSATYVCPAADTNAVFTLNRLLNEHPTTLSGYSAVGAAFQANATCYLYNATFQLKKEGSPTGDLIAYLYQATGTVGTNAVPTAVLIEYSSLVDVETVYGSYLPITFTFTGTSQLTSGSSYAIAVAVYDDTSGWASVTEDVCVGTSTGAAYSNIVVYKSSSWTAYANTTSTPYFILNGDTDVETDPTPTPSPSPTPAPSSSGDADIENLTAIILPWLVPLLVCLIPALLGYKFVGELGFFIGLNVGVILAYVTLAGTAYAFPLWGIILVGVMDVAVVLMRR